MCAITGFVEKKRTAELSVLEAMTKVLKHRGPDDTGTVIKSMFGSNNNLALGFNRLSIRDLSSAGHQPMNNETNDIIITFNGEIYNADDYRTDLTSKGYVFRSKSDTEIILYLYQEYGIDELLKKIDGMFAICITDLRNDCIFLIRDRLGEKPLYYYESESCLLWASEYKAFYEHPEFTAQLDCDNLSEYCMFRYVSDGDTLLKGVKNLKPGSYLRITKNEIIKNSYWSFPSGSYIDDNSEKEIKELFNKKLEKAYSSRLVSDVEIGLQLSGGVDSSCLCEYVSRVYPQKLKAFGIIFEGRDYSEQKYMEEVAKKCNVDLHLYNFTNDLFLKSWLATSYYFEAPMNHEGTLGLYYLNKRASEFVKVMLCGEGADETMGGYDRFFSTAACRKSFIFRTAYFLRNILKNKTFDYNLFFGDFDSNFVKATQFVKNSSAKRMYKKCDASRVIKKRHALLKSIQGTKFRQLMNYETATYCQDLLMRADKVSMASSLEVRVPYLAPELIEFENMVPDNYFVSYDSFDVSKNTKKILKDRCSNLFGDEFTFRRKMGFGIPLMDFFSKGEVKNYIDTIILPGIQKRGIFNYDFINKTYCRKIQSGGGESSIVNMLWVCFSFEIWAQLYLDGNPNKIFNSTMEDYLKWD